MSSAKASGTILVQAVNEGTQGLFQLAVTLSSDSDGDGIPDDVEIRLGLNPIILLTHSMTPTMTV